MKTIFVTIPEDIIARNIFFTRFWEIFLQEHVAEKIVLLAPPDRAEKYRTLWPNIVVEAYKRAAPSRLEDLVMTLCRSGINTHTNLWSKMRSYLRGDSGFFATYIKRGVTATLGRSNTYKRLLRKLVLLFSSDKNLKSLFDRYNPVEVFCTSLTNFDFDVLVAREAKQRKIRLLGMVRSWDNLSSHGLLRVVPDVFFLQNPFLKEMALRYQAIREKDTTFHIVGIPHYDDLSKAEQIAGAKEDFVASKGLDLHKPLLLYGAMGEFLFPHEHTMPALFEQILSKEMTGELQMLYRAHPKFMLTKPTDSFTSVVVDTGGAYIHEKKEEGNADLIRSLYWSDVVITAASTVAIDGAMLGKPVVCVAFDGATKKASYWESVERFFDCYTHVEALAETKGVRVVRSPQEFVRAVKEYLKTPSLDTKGRERIREYFAPYIGQSSERLSHLLSEELTRIL